MRNIIKYFKERRNYGLHTVDIFKDIIQIIFDKLALKASLTISKMIHRKTGNLVVSAQNTYYRQLIGEARKGTGAVNMGKWLSSHRDANYAFLVYKYHIGQLRKKCNFYIKDKVIVEVGPGSNLGLSLILIASGASKVHNIDKYNSLSQNLSQLYKELVEKIRRNPNWLFVEESVDSETVQKRLKGVITFKDNEAVLNSEKVIYNCPCDAANLPFGDATIDLVLSHAVLEHVTNLPKVISEMARVLKPRGYVSCHIDLRDHRDFNTPLDFLRYPPALWNIINYKGSHGNRIRFCEYLRLFHRAGFEVVDCHAQVLKDIPEVVKKGFYKKFRNLSEDEISVLRFYLIARRLPDHESRSK